MPTITFSEFGIGTVNPTFTFDDNTVTTTGQIVGDGAQPNTPVIAANTSYTGPVFLYFENPVTSVSMDVGYFNNLGSTRIEFRDQLGRVIQSFHNTALGVLPFSLTHDAGIASVAVIDEAFDAAGFSVDTVVFGPNAEALTAPTAALFTGDATADRDFGDVEGNSTLVFTDQVGETDANDYITLTVDVAVRATVRTYLNGDPENATEVTIDLAAGENTIQITQGENYGDLEDYTVIVQVADFVDPDDEFINDLQKNIFGAVMDFQESKFKIFAHITENLDNADEAVELLGKIGRAWKVIGLTLDLANRIDNIRAANDWKRQTAIELADFIVSLAAPGAVGLGISFVGTPIAGVVGGFVSSLIYEFALSSYVKDYVGEQYDIYINNNNNIPQQAGAFDITFNEPDFSDLIFDEVFYLATYADAAEAVASGAAVNGLFYYLTVGINEGHQINSTGRTVDPNNLLGDVTIDEAGVLFDNQLGVHELGTRAGDLLTDGEVAMVAFVNNERTDTTELALNAALSALANRVAQDWILNNQETIELLISENGPDWAETLSNGESFRTVLDALATGAGIDLDNVTLLASWGAGESASDVYDSLITSTDALSALVGLDSASIGIAQVGGIWILLISTDALADDGVASDESLLRILGDEDANEILGAGGGELISALEGNDDVSGGGGNDSLLGGEGNDLLDGGVGNDTLLGGEGNDTLRGGETPVSNENQPDFPVPDGTGSQTLGSDVINEVDAPVPLADEWSIEDFDDVENPTTRPHLTLDVTGSGNLREAFSFDAADGQTWIFDIDGATFDTVVEIYDENGNFLASDDDSSTSEGAGGSTSGRDSYLEYEFTTTGSYIVAVRGFGSPTLQTTDTFTLNISVDGATWEDPEPVAANDSLLGGAGHDWLIGQGGQDTLLGGDGIDIAFFDFNLADVFTWMSGNALVVGGGPESPTQLEDVEVLSFLDGTYGLDELQTVGNDWVDRIGTDGAETLSGTTSDDEIAAGGGSDLAFGGEGDDGIFGQAGNDSLYGGLDSDTLLGGAGSDLLGGGAGNDFVSGGADADSIFGSSGDDTLLGDGGADLIGGFTGDDSIDGGAGADALWGSFGNDTILGGDGNDTLGGFDGDDSLEGGADNDEMWGGRGADTMLGGTGNDTLGGFFGNNDLEGGEGDDELWAATGNDELNGGTGNDTLGASSGDDTLEGGEGDDVIFGGLGADLFVFGAASGADSVSGFNLADGDRLELDDAIWSGSTLTAGQVVSTYGSVVNGTVQLAFTANDIITLNGVNTLTGLDAAIDIV